MKIKATHIYFLCGQNRCRSQMAEAFAKHYGGEHVVVESAGLEPVETLHPFTIEVMQGGCRLERSGKHDFNRRDGRCVEAAGR